MAIASVLLIMYLVLPVQQNVVHPKERVIEQLVDRTGPDSPILISATVQPASSKTQMIFPKRSPISREGPEIRQVVFSKVHKAASSTMQNIFFRFSLARNLSVLLPKKQTSISENSRYIHRNSVVPHPEGKQFYDILCSHVLFDQEQISKFFPETAARIAIVREPVKQALSALVYYFTVWDPTRALRKGCSRYKDDPINSFLRHPQHFYNQIYGPSASYINNRMSVDLGFDLNEFEASKRNTTKIQTFLRQVQAQFDLVLLSDYFDESLVLMRRTLRWSMRDIVYLQINVKKKDKNSVWLKEPILNSEIRQRFRDWDVIDFQLYDHFLNIFLRTISKEPLFQEELKVFRAVQMDVKYFCLINKTAKSLIIPESAWNDKFTISRYDCELMAMEEIPMTSYMRSKQHTRYIDHLKKPSNTSSSQGRKRSNRGLGFRK